MILLPIIARELRVRARSRATHWTRFGSGAVAVMFCVPQLVLASASRTPASLGTSVFNDIVLGAFLLCCSACLLTADGISAERREGTLPLLFLTRVKTLDLLLGKLGAVSLTSVGALATFLPVLMVPVFVGGVTSGDVFRKGLTLLNALFFALAAGLFVSAAQQERARAVRNTLLLLAAALFVPFLFFVGSRNVLHYLGVFSPLVSVSLAGEAQYTASRALCWVSVAVVHLLAWALVSGAGMRLRRTVGNAGGSSISRPPTEEAQNRAVNLGRWRPLKEEAGPIEWLVHRQYGVNGGIWALAMLGLAFEGWVALHWQPMSTSTGPFSWLFIWPFGAAGAVFGSALIAWMAGRFFVGVRRSGELELLLTTPLGAEAIVTEQWQVLKRLFVWPALALQAPLLPQCLALLAGAGSGKDSGWAMLLWIFDLLSLGTTLLGAAAICRVGLWLGLKAQTQAGAVLRSVALVKGLPCMLSLLTTAIGTVLARSGIPPRGWYVLVFWLPQIMTALFYLGLIRLAKERLLKELAELDVKPFDFWAEIKSGLRDLFASAECVASPTASAA